VKLWVVGHAYVAELAHGKLQALAALPDIDLTLLVPTAWRTALGLVPLSAPPAPPYRIVPSEWPDRRPRLSRRHARAAPGPAGHRPG